jgi:hypothetical protein
MVKVTIKHKVKELSWSSIFKTKELAKSWLEEQLKKPNRLPNEVDVEFESLIKDEEELKKKEVAKEIEQKLTDTIWAMLPDARLSQEGRKLFKDYRDYLKDFFELYDRKQILELKVKNFDEWRKDPPVYKLEKKVIL